MHVLATTATQIPTSHHLLPLELNWLFAFRNLTVLFVTQGMQHLMCDLILHRSTSYIYNFLLGHAVKEILTQLMHQVHWMAHNYVL
jgi:hypothetical protein